MKAKTLSPSAISCSRSNPLCSNSTGTLYRFMDLRGSKTSRFIILWILLFVIVILVTYLFSACSNQHTLISNADEIEAAEFQGTKLTPIAKQLNNALAGTQYIDRDTYRLTVDGLVENPLTLTYDQLLSYPQESWLMDLTCVEGWSFTAKWTGPELNSIFKDAGVTPDAKIVIFYTADVPEGYSSLDLSYIRDNDIIIALKLNDVTLPQERGFPFQLVAKSKYGYEWAKWITRIELSSDINFRGYWKKNPIEAL